MEVMLYGTFATQATCITTWNSHYGLSFSPRSNFTLWGQLQAMPVACGPCVFQASSTVTVGVGRWLMLSPAATLVVLWT